MFKNMKCSCTIELLCTSLYDCVIFQIQHSDLVIAAQYIPPANSTYYDDVYIDNLNLIHDKYHSRELIITGDLNARIGDIRCINPAVSYRPNPDTAVNSHGKKLLKWLSHHQDMIVVNGSVFNNKICDTNFTFYRGNMKSQNDITLTNRIDRVNSMTVEPKLIFSDHCPISITYTTNVTTPLDFVYECTRSYFSNEHYDINYRMRPAIKFDKLDVTKLIQNLSKDITTTENDDTTNVRAVKIADHIYNACQNSYAEREENEPLTDNLVNCRSSHFKAIAEANLFAHDSLSRDGIDATQYVENWIRFEKLAKKASNDELNVRRNKSWRDKRYDGKELWKAIDWNGRAEVKTEKPAYEADTIKYFTGIFNSLKTKDDPTVADVVEDLSRYEMYIPSLDNRMNMDELDDALRLIGTGVSLDGIPPAIAKVLPQPLKEMILDLVNQIFFGQYPDEWCKQILHAIKKDGHSPRNPKLRGIAIAPFLCRVYDITIDVRFLTWFTPNKEQASQSKQGCPLQIFMLFLIIDYSAENEKNLFIGFLDYEKAYDYVNRAGIVSKLIQDGCGSAFTKAIAGMFSTSTYYPKSNKNRLSEGISTDFGVTQGRRSSGSLFSYYVSDMPSAVGDVPYDDFMDPLALAQLADDTALYAEMMRNLRTKFQKVFNYSRERRQHANIPKTMYGNFTRNPTFEPLIVNENITINSINQDEGYRYLGTFVYPTNDITEIIQRNVNKRMVNVSKYYSWLSVKEWTPVDVKILVFDSCVFKALLCGVECWGNISFLEKKLIDLEIKALKTILQVKKGTTNDLIYHELRRPSIVATIKDLQYNFFKKLIELPDDTAIVKTIINICRGSRMIRYYENLDSKNAERDINDRNKKIAESQSSMCKYYRELGLMERTDIYSSMLYDYYRIIVTRWRLSNHSLNIETGRYTRPYTERPERVCTMCTTVVEDEHHVIFICPRYDNLRTEHDQLVRKSTTVAAFLNPCEDDMKSTATYLRDIEKRRSDLHLD